MTGITVEGVWKRYQRGERADTLRELVGRSLRRNGGDRERGRESFWALKDVSFQVRPGEVLGVIGANGAGKSTLLKILTGILEPERGSVSVQGRVGAVIELAAGFHPDLTGRENVFLQGAVMGMTRAEIERKYEEIIDFAEVGDFVDTPIKRYSSGMTARLGFSIAAHMDPDVLLVDEVLSVGDFAFQRKAEARLREVVSRDIPVVIVSHRMDRITKLCDQAILLAEGAVVQAGSAEACVSAYIDGRHLAASPTESPIVLRSVESDVDEAVPSGTRVRVVVKGRVRDGTAGAVVGLRLWGVPDEELLFVTHNEVCHAPLPTSGSFTLEMDVALHLGPGVYRLQPCVLGLDPYTEWMRGDSVVVEVLGSRTIVGRVGLDPRMDVGVGD